MGQLSPRSMRVKQVLGGLMLVSLCAVAAACGSDDSASSGTTGASAKQATGQPIQLGMYNQEGTPAGSFENYRMAVEATVRYINEQLGGVDGRPLKVAKCITNASPESSSACANELVQAKPVAIIGGYDYTPFASLPIYERAGVSVVGDSGYTVAELRSKSAFNFGGSTAASPALAVYTVKTLGAKRVAVLYPDNPPGQQLAKLVLKPALEALGATTTLVAVSDKAPDLTPAVRTAAKSGDALIAVTSPNRCLSLLQAHQQLGDGGPALVTVASCSKQNIIQSFGGALKNVTFGLPINDINPNDPETKQYEAAMKKYADGDLELDDVAAQGFANTMNLYDGLKKIGASKISSASVTRFLQDTVDQHDWMRDPYTCSPQKLPIRGLPGACNTALLMATVQGGKLEVPKSGWTDGAGYLPQAAVDNLAASG
jgi:branched-chain amino acid transport system substrate-binding protein